MSKVAAKMTSESKDSYIPKDATQQNEFIKKYPKYDGRGLVIAILDTSVDVSVDGLQKTSTGLPKIIDCYDFTVFGHVDTSTVREMDSNNVVIGLSGTALKIPTKWKNPSGKWHLGLKPLYELCPDVVLEKIIKERQAAIEKENTAIKQKFSKQFKAKGEVNYDALREYLLSTENLSKDSLVADCIVWFDGKNWLACIDASLTGYLKWKKVLKNFCDGQEYATVFAQLTYCVNIYNDGNLLEIYTPYDDHGTGVSHIAAGYFPAEPKKDGLAPGAQIIPMTVYDSRSGNLLCKYSLRSALLKCLELKVDIVNCAVTYFHKENEELINEMTEKHGMIIIKSAGNYGSIYASVSEYDPLYKNIFVIGGVDNKYEDAFIPYYSSHGPGLDGSRGITFVVPGDAVTVNSRFNPEKTMATKGTSNAAPFAAGSMACLISALKANSIEYSAAILKVAISRTAYMPKNGDRLAYGHGIMQIMAAFEFLKNCKTSIIQEFINLKNETKFKNEIKNGAVIKLREKESVEILKTLDNTNIKLELVSKVPERFVSSIKNNTINVKVDTNILLPGTANYAEIHGTSFLKPLFNPVLHYPITVIVPKKITKDDNYRIIQDVILKPNTPHRLFLLPPESSNHCIIKVTSPAKVSANIHFQWGMEDSYCTPGKWLYFRGKENTQTFQIKTYWNSIHEFSLMSRNCMEPLNFNVEYIFYGIYVKSPLSIKSETENEEAKSCDRNVIEFANYFENLTAKLSLEFNQVSYEITPIKTCYETFKSVYEISQKNCLKKVYTFNVPETAKSFFEMNLKNEFRLYKIQFFTESKKFVYSFNGYRSPKSVSLLPGKYLIIAYILNVKSDSETGDLLSSDIIPSITVTVDLFKSICPDLYNSAETTAKSIKDEFIDFKEKIYKTYIKEITTNDLPKLSPSNTILQGTMNFKNQNTNLEVPISHQYCFNHESDDKENSKDLSNSLEKLFDSLSIAEALKIQKENFNAKDAAKDILPVEKQNKIDKVKTSKRKQKKNYIYPINDPLRLIQAVNYENEIFKNNESNMLKSEISDLQNNIAQIKQALTAEHYGKALLHLNKLSTKNQTNPAFKVVDLAIIELLKHLKWDHLVKAHQHAMLDRHRDYYRLF